jgi:hypothetical protein
MCFKPVLTCVGLAFCWVLCIASDSMGDGVVNAGRSECMLCDVGSYTNESGTDMLWRGACCVVVNVALCCFTSCLYSVHICVSLKMLCALESSVCELDDGLCAIFALFCRASLWFKFGCVM